MIRQLKVPRGEAPSTFSFEQAPTFLIILHLDIFYYPVLGAVIQLGFLSYRADLGIQAW